MQYAEYSQYRYILLNEFIHVQYIDVSLLARLCEYKFAIMLLRLII